MSRTSYAFRPADYQAELSAILQACREHDRLDRAALQEILRRHPKDGRGFFSKSELVRGYRWLEALGAIESDGALLARLQMKPVRTRSGVAPVTVLTQPYPCPGRCIFCPSDVRMPKSYVSSEPGAQRAAEHRFDPYAQTASRLASLHNIGHPVDKVELIVLGGTWSTYPEGYRLWFLARCLEALNDFDPVVAATTGSPAARVDFAFEEVTAAVDGGRLDRTYNDVLRGLLARGAAPDDAGNWEGLETQQRRNERARCRCVGLVLETRPDHLDSAEVVRLRRFGATKVQIGYQSLDDAVLRANRRGHDVAATRRAM
ncbi:MAG: radical SAM protein, partial [Thermoanaerobaculia bacterium]|nr:radical SAM protein [Thermoanaerobaculia bacterium]